MRRRGKGARNPFLSIFPPAGEKDRALHRLSLIHILNTAISGFMEHNNKLLEIAKKEGGIDKETLSTMAVLLSPFAPHIAEEIWEQLGHEGSVFRAGWPTYDEEAMKDDEIEVPVQINGKTRAVISISADISKDCLLYTSRCV